MHTVKHLVYLYTPKLLMLESVHKLASFPDLPANVRVVSGVIVAHADS